MTERKDTSRTVVNVAEQPSPESIGEQLNFERSGTGEPLLLLHGFGSHLRIWDPVRPLLEHSRHVVAVDFPGFGRSPEFSMPKAPEIADYCTAIETFIDALGLSDLHIAGNSAGGWIGLELAKRGRARSVVCLAPTGLWRKGAPPWVVLSTTGTLAIANTLAPWAQVILKSRAGRTMFMSQTFGRPWAMPADVAYQAVVNLLKSPGTAQGLDASRNDRFRAGHTIQPPVTVVFGRRDWALLPHHRRRRELPPTTRWVVLPRCGHVPTWDDPERVAAVMLAGTADSAGSVNAAVAAEKSKEASN